MQLLNNTKRFLWLGSASIIFYAVGFLTPHDDAMAAGYFVREQGSALQGASYAGVTAETGALSAVFFNPATLANFNQSEVSVDAALIAPTIDFTVTDTTIGNLTSPTGSTSGDAGVFALVPATSGVYPINEDWNVGFTLNAPFGLTTDYGEDWAGRYHATESSLTTISFSPLASYKANQSLSFGFGPTLQYMQGELVSMVNQADIATAFSILGTYEDGRSTLSATALGYGAVAGMQYQPNEKTVVGASYRSRVKHKLDGDIDFDNIDSIIAGVASGAFDDTDASTEITTPDMISMGVQHQLSDHIRLLGEFSWTNWSLFDQLIIEKDNGAADSVRDYHYEDSIFVAAGAIYHLDPNTDLQFGLAYDQQADRGDDEVSFSIPDADRIWMSSGLQHQTSTGMVMSLGYSLVNTEDFTTTAEGTTSSQAGNVTVDFNNAVHILNMGLQFRW